MTAPTDLRSLLVLHEGRVSHVYPDSLGFLTIGVGHLVDPRRGGKLPEHIIDALLDYDIAEHVAELEKYQPWAKSLDPVRHAALADMCFNLGTEPFDGDGFKDWPLFVGQMKAKAWPAAAANMRSTLWAKQVGARAERLAKMVESGSWPVS